MISIRLLAKTIAMTYSNFVSDCLRVFLARISVCDRL